MKFVAGIDLGGTNTKAMLADASFTKLFSRSMPTRRELGSEKILANIVDMLAAMIADAGLAESDLEAIAIGVPGLADFEKKTALKLGSLYWFDVPIAAPFEKRFNVPVVLDNDGNINVLGEQCFGAGKGYEDLVLITLGTGLGGGAIAGGRLLRGTSGLAGEFGHMIVEIDGAPCRCGRRGCFQYYCSTPGITDHARELMDSNPGSALWELTGGDPANFTPKMMDEGFDKNDPACRAILERASHYLGTALASLVSILNPALILLGGGISHSGERLIAPARELVRATVSHPAQMCEIRRAELGVNAGTYGACALAWEKARSSF